MANLVCSGPGPHIPVSGILGTTDKPGTDVRCPAAACIKPVDPTVANANDLQSKVQAALTSNAAYLALASPTAAQTTAQVKALTREISALIRLTQNLLDDTTGT